MPEPLPIEIVLPAIIRLFPQLVKNAPVVGKIVPLIDVKASQDEELARALKRNYKRPKKANFNDEIYVIKLEDAIDCVEKAIGDGKLQTAGMITLAKMLFDQRTGGSPIGDKIITCLRENVLRQDTPRVIKEFRGYHRPAKGHGKGRGKV